MQEERFYGQWVARFACLLVGFCGFITFYFMVVLAIQRVTEGWWQVWMLVMSIPFGLLGLAIGAYCVYGLIESFARVVLDARGVTKQALYSTRRMEWAYIVAVRMGSKPESAITLTDDAGHRLRLEVGLLRDPEGRLRAAVEERLAHLREAEQRQFGATTHTYTPERSLGWLWLVLTFLFGGFWVMGLTDANMVGKPSGVALLVAVFCVFVVPFVLGTLHSFSRRVTVTSGAITDVSLLRRRAIPLDRIESLMVRDVRTKNGTMNLTTVVGAGQKITLSDMMPEYALIRDFLRERAGQEAEARGLESLPAHERRTNRVGFAVVVAFMALMGGGASFYTLQESGERLVVQDRIDARGVRTDGTVTRLSSTSGDSSAYYVYYAFQVNGRTYQRVSPVTREDFMASRVGQTVTLLYVPENPDDARLTNSIGRRNAERQRWFGVIFLVICLCFPCLLFTKIRKDELRREAEFRAKRAEV